MPVCSGSSWEEAAYLAALSASRFDRIDENDEENDPELLLAPGEGSRI
jgi:hypothetical protein